MPAAPLIAPLLCATAVKITAAPVTAVPVTTAPGESFGQVLQSARDAASGPADTLAPANDAHAPSALPPDDPKAAPPAEAASEPAAIHVGNGPATARIAALSDKAVRRSNDPGVVYQPAQTTGAQAASPVVDAGGLAVPAVDPTIALAASSTGGSAAGVAVREATEPAVPRAGSGPDGVQTGVPQAPPAEAAQPVSFGGDTASFAGPSNIAAMPPAGAMAFALDKPVAAGADSPPAAAQVGDTAGDPVGSHVSSSAGNSGAAVAAEGKTEPNDGAGALQTIDSQRAGLTSRGAADRSDRTAAQGATLPSPATSRVAVQPVAAGVDADRSVGTSPPVGGAAARAASAGADASHAAVGLHPTSGEAGTSAAFVGDAQYLVAPLTDQSVDGTVVPPATRERAVAVAPAPAVSGATESAIASGRTDTRPGLPARTASDVTAESDKAANLPQAAAAPASRAAVDTGSGTVAPARIADAGGHANPGVFASVSVAASSPGFAPAGPMLLPRSGSPMPAPEGGRAALPPAQLTPPQAGVAGQAEVTSVAVSTAPPAAVPAGPTPVSVAAPPLAAFDAAAIAAPGVSVPATSGTPMAGAAGMPVLAAAATSLASAADTPVAAAAGTPVTAAADTSVAAVAGPPETAAAGTPVTAVADTSVAAAAGTPIVASAGESELAEAGVAGFAVSGASAPGGGRRTIGVAASQPVVQARPVPAGSSGLAAGKVVPADRVATLSTPSPWETPHTQAAALAAAAPATSGHPATAAALPDVSAAASGVGAGPVTAAAGGPTASQTAQADHKAALHEAQADTGPTLPAAVALPGQAAPAATPATTAAETPAAAAPTSGAAAPAAQLAPALLTLAKAIDGSQQMTVRMQPADLGMVQVRIAHAASGGTQIEISAENPATLQALQRDQPQLHRTLDEAGVPVAGRTVTFHVAAAAVPAAAGGAGAGAAGGHSHSQPNSGGRANTGTADADGSAGSGRGSYPARERNTYSTARRPVPAPATAKANAAPAGTSYRIGLDITA